MKVSEVIALLGGMNQDAEVIFPDFLPVVRVVEIDDYVVVTDQYEDHDDEDDDYDDEDGEDGYFEADDEDRCMGCGCKGCNGNCCQ